MPDYRVERPSSPDDLIGAAVEEVSSAYAEAAGTKRAQKVLANATPGQRLLCAWYFYWDDVTNGGHSQYFANYTADLWEEAMDACEKFRVPEAAILRDALALFPDGKPAKSYRAREKQLEAIDREKLNELDSRFYDKPESDQEVREYIEAHATEFFADGGE